MPPDIQQGDLIMAIVLEWLTVVRAWALTSDDSVVFSAVTSIAMIGLVGAYNINTELLVYFGLYVVSATFLLLHQNYLVHRSWSSRPQDGESENLVLRVQIGLSLASAIVVVLVSAVVIIPLRAAGSHLSLGNALRNLVAIDQKAGDPGVAQAAGADVQLSDDKALKVGTGEGFSASDTVVLHALPNDHQEHYWRGRTYDTYEGNGWVSSIGDQHVPLTPGADDAPNSPAVAYPLLQHLQIGGKDALSAYAQSPVRSQTFTRIEVASGRMNTLYLPYDTTRVLIARGNALTLDQGRDNNISLSGEVSDGFSYGVLSLRSQVSPALLRAAPAVAARCPVEIRRYYVDQVGQQVVSDSEQARLKQLASHIVAALPKSRRTEYDIAEAIRSYVSQQATYSLTVSPVPEDQDAVSYFLFDSKRGYCDLFASAMAVLCRYAGLPARVATGFAPGVRNAQNGFDLRGLDKHAWVEVWFPQYGWNEFDPTIGSRADASINHVGGGINGLRSLWAQIMGFFNINGPFPFVLFALVLLGLAYVIKVEVIDRVSRRLGEGMPLSEYRSLAAARKASSAAAMQWSRDAARVRYARMEDLLAKADLMRLPSVTPLEFQRELKARVDDLEFVAPGLAKFILPSVTALTEEMMLAAYAPLELSGPVSLEHEEAGVGDKALRALEQQLPALRRAAHAKERADLKHKTPA